MKTAQEIVREWQAQMNDHSIKCPRCGSTTQVRQTRFDRDEEINLMVRTFECGCGTRFHKWYQEYNGFPFLIRQKMLDKRPPIEGE